MSSMRYMANHETAPEPIDHDAAAGAGSEQGRAPQITLRGKVAREPEFDYVKEGALYRGRFSLAHHPNPEDRNETVWYQVVTFGQAAQTLHEWFASGHLQAKQDVDITGRAQDYEYTG